MSTLQNSGDLNRYLNFTLNSEFYALPLLTVKEVIGQLPTTPIPNAPAHFVGLINLRGLVIPILDLRQKLKLPKSQTGHPSTVIILDMETYQIGINVDSVESVQTFKEADIERSGGNFDAMIGGHFLEGVAKRDKNLILLLDIKRALTGSDLNVVKASTAHNKAA